jgi:hypothetical protein
MIFAHFYPNDMIGYQSSNFMNTTKVFSMSYISIGLCRAKQQNKYFHPTSAQICGFHKTFKKKKTFNRTNKHKATEKEMNRARSLNAKTPRHQDAKGLSFPAKAGNLIVSLPVLAPPLLLPAPALQARTIVLLLLGAGILLAQDRPNILWLTVEDISPHLGCYGYDDARTPNLDQLATDGVMYTNAYMTAPVCAVTRSSLLTGLYSCTQGSHHMRNDANLGENVNTYPEYMKAAGYYCTNPGKTDYQGLAGTGIWDSNPNNYWDRPNKSVPFMHVANHTGTHESQNRGDAGSFDPQQIQSLPPYYPNTDKTRRFWASYYQNITDMDNWVGQRLAELENSGEADNTIVIYYSDHGVGFPRGKRWVYDSGLKVPWMSLTLPKLQYRPTCRGAPSWVET